MDPKHGSGNNKDSMEDAEAIRYTRDELGPMISLLDSKHDSGTRAHTKFTINEGTVGWVEKSKSTHSLSSSSSDSSVEDFFQMDQEVLPQSHTSPASSREPPGDVPPLLKDDKKDIPSDTSKSEKPKSWSPGATFLPISDETHESLLHSMSTTQTPPIQVMERTGDYEPHGFPSSIFARNSSTPMGWSIASNDSLFSLNFGNNSSSRDHPLMFGDLYSGEFYKSGELHKSGELNWFGQPHPAPVEGENDVKCLDMQEKSRETRVSDDQREKVVPNRSVHDEGEVKLPPPERPSNSPIANCGPRTSTQPLAFPTKKSSAWRFCQCSSCRWMLCYGCKRERKRCSSASSEENLTNDGTRTSRKGSPKKKALQPPDDAERSQKPHSKKSWCFFPCRSCSFWWCC